MPQDADEFFYQRADAQIHLANDQTKETGGGKVSASFIYAASRFNAWRSACSFENSDDMKAGREEAIAYFVAEYRKCLIENLDDYIDNFDQYMKPSH